MSIKYHLEQLSMELDRLQAENTKLKTEQKDLFKVEEYVKLIDLPQAPEVGYDRYYRKTFRESCSEDVPDNQIDDMIASLEGYIKKCQQLYETNKQLAAANLEIQKRNKANGENLINFFYKTVGLPTSKHVLVRGKNKSVECEWLKEIRSHYAPNSSVGTDYIDAAISSAKMFIEKLQQRKRILDEAKHKKRQETAKLGMAIKFLQEHGVDNIDMLDPITQATDKAKSMRAQGKYVDMLWL